MIRSHLLYVTVAFAGCASQPNESCPMSIAAYCNGKTQNCPQTWAAAQDVASWRCGPNTDGAVTLSTCGNVHVASVAYVDAGEDFYYDGNGQLYRVESFVNTKQDCLAGSGQALGSHGMLDCNDPNPIILCRPGF
jgi:hypothetical protein